MMLSRTFSKGLTQKMKDMMRVKMMHMMVIVHMN